MRTATYRLSKPTPAQIDMIDRLAAGNGALPYNTLVYRDLVVLGELQRISIAVVDVAKAAHLTQKGYALKDAGYVTDEVMVQVTQPQLEFLQLMMQAPSGEHIGLPMTLLPGRMIDLCRRMSIRGWAEWYDVKERGRWARLTQSGIEAAKSIESVIVATAASAAARRIGNLH